MKILYTNFHAGNGGGHVTYIINLAKALSKDHQITVAAPATSRLHRYAKAIPGVRVEDMQYTTRPSSWFKDRAQLRRLIKSGGFDIIQAPDLDAALEWGRKLARAITLPIEVRPFQHNGT